MDGERMWSLSSSERLVLQEIWRHAPIARHTLSERTGLAGASVTRITRGLEDLGLVVDEVRRDGARGQPARPVSLKADGAFAFGVYFSHSYMDVGLVDLAGRLVSSERVRFETARAEVIAEAAREGLLRQIAAAGVSLDRVVGAGFALPGDFGETPAFLKAHAYFPELLDQDLAALLSARMPVRVFVENDAASAALGEHVHGIGRASRSFAFIHIGHGVGGGLVLDGRLYRGAHGNAGIIGVLYPMSAPRPSGQDLLETLIAAGVHAPDFDALEQLRPEDCPPLRRWISRAGEQLGVALHLTARMLDPDALVIGGRLPPHLLEALMQAIDLDAAFSASRNLPVPKVAISRLGPYAGLIGAASICVFRAFLNEAAG
jgi:predicted NBD/HSP70 family sugar kinase